MPVKLILVIYDRFKISSLCSYFTSGHQTWESSCKFKLLAQGIFQTHITEMCAILTASFTHVCCVLAGYIMQFKLQIKYKASHIYLIVWNDIQCK